MSHKKMLKFAAACAGNSKNELLDAAEQKHADREDMRAWGITATEWRRAIFMALRAEILGGVVTDNGLSLPDPE